MRLEISGIAVRFKNRVVFDDFSAVFGSGLTAIMGPSGSGKSTLLSVIAGHLVPQKGHVVLPRPESRVDWIVQSAPVLWRRSALDNVMLGPLSAGASHHLARQSALSAMTLVGVDELATTPAFQLSGGERQRIAVARAIGTGSDVILADEPTASLDPGSREAVCDALERAGTSGRVVLVATHDAYVRDRCQSTLAIERMSGGTGQ